MGFTRQEVSAARAVTPRLFRRWMENPEEAVSCMPPDRFLSDAELKTAEEWTATWHECGLVAIPVSFDDAPPRVLEVFGPLGTRDEGMSPELIIYPIEDGFVVEPAFGDRTPVRTIEEALAVIRG
ncbi:hypothetical protein ACFW16_32605 [Inquilinus sp. NPDC058860]|uniref:hypothetical protein n=1 Tax=Inquilinus sp. NPDC058860 TaxID=3346652 RepID=UPI0036B9327F